MSSVEIELTCGWKVVGDPTIPRGKESLRVVDADGELVTGVQSLSIDKASPNDFTRVNVELAVAQPPADWRG